MARDSTWPCMTASPPGHSTEGTSMGRVNSSRNSAMRVTSLATFASSSLRDRTRPRKTTYSGARKAAKSCSGSPLVTTKSAMRPGWMLPRRSCPMALQASTVARRTMRAGVKPARFSKDISSCSAKPGTIHGCGAPLPGTTFAPLSSKSFVMRPCRSTTSKPLVKRAGSR